jgi:hypothetical protein
MKRILSIIIVAVIHCTTVSAQVTEAEALSFGKKMDASFLEGNYQIINQNLSFRSFCKRLGAMGQNKAFRKGLEQSFKLSDNIEKEVGSTGSYRLLRVRKRGEDYCPQFRLVGQDGGLNYHEYLLTKIDGEIAIVDFYSAIGDEFISETVRNVLDKMSENNKASTKIAGQIVKLNKYRDEQDYKATVKYISKLPDDIQKTKLIQLMNLRAAMQLEDTSIYLKAIDGYKSTNPSQEHLSLIMLDAHVLRQEYKQGVATINELDKQLGGDPFLDYQRFLYYKLAADTLEARKCIDRGAKNCPNENFIQLEMIAVLHDEKDTNKEAYETALKTYRDNKYLSQDLLKAYLEQQGEDPMPAAKPYKAPTTK